MEGGGWGAGEGGVSFAVFLSTAAVWCVPFFGTVGLFNKLQTQKKSGETFTAGAATYVSGTNDTGSIAIRYMSRS